MAFKQRKRRKIRNLGPQMSSNEKHQITTERNIAVFDDACALVSPSLPEYTALCLKRQCRSLRGSGEPVPIGMPEVSAFVDDKNNLQVEIRCWLDYGGVQAYVVLKGSGGLWHIPFTYTDEARITLLEKAIRKRLNHTIAEIFRSVPKAYPSLKHGDPEFESHFAKVTYVDFDKRMKRNEANFLFRKLTREADNKPDCPDLLLSELCRQAKDELNRKVSELQGVSPGEDEVAPIGVRDILYTVGTISNNMRFWVQGNAIVEYPSDIEDCDKNVRFKVIVQLPLNFGAIKDPDAGLNVLREGLLKAQSELLPRLVNSVAYRKLEPVAPMTEDELETESTNQDEPAASDGEDSAISNNSMEVSPKRKRAEQTPEQKLITKYRKKSPRHVLVTEADVNRSEAMRIFSMSTAARLFKNKLIEIYKPLVDKLGKNEEYKKLRKKYGEIKKELNGVAEDTDEYKTLEGKRKEIGDKMQSMQVEAGLTWDLLRETHKRIRPQFPLTSVFALSAAEDVWKAVESVLYGNGRSIHFGRYGTYPLLRAKQPDGEIIFNVEDNKLQFSMNLMPEHDERKAFEASLRKTAQEKKRAELLEEIQKKQESGAQLSEEESVLLSNPDALPELNEAEKANIRAQRNANCWEKFEFGLVEDPTDRFLNDELARVIAFLKNPASELEAAKKWEETKKIQDTFRPCYAALSCMRIRGKYRVFVHITIDGRPCEKFKKDGSPRHLYGVGRLGADIGTQSTGSVSDSNVDLSNLAERSGKSTFASENKLKRINRYLDRARRASNPDNYNEDGTCKKGRKTWVYSESAKDALNYARELDRKNARSREYAINQKAWEMRAEADILITEPNCVKAWATTGKAKRRREREEAAQKAEESKNVQVAVEQVEPDSDQNSKSKKKKGHRRKTTNKHRCPGKMMAKLKQVFESTGGKFILVSKMFRASQYDHELNEYIKKKLSQRWHVLGKTGRKVQRDIYSAFLLYCSDLEHKAPDLERCKAKFDEFYARHEALIADIVKGRKKICNSGIRF